MTYPTCGAEKKHGTGQKCGKPAGWGTSHPGFGRCKLHGGASPSGIKAALLQEAKAELAEITRQVMGEAWDVDPMDALLWCIRITAGEVQYATYKVSQMSEDEAIVTYVEEIERSGGGANVADYEKKSSNRGELNIWIQVRQNSVDRLARFSKMALDAGVAERAVRLAESAGESLAGVLRKILDGLELSYEQELRAPDIVREALQELEGPNVLGAGLLKEEDQTDPRER